MLANNLTMILVMERAIHITKLENLERWNYRYQRIYWGAEFCQNLIPEIEETEKVLRFVEDRNLSFTLVTPFVTERGLEKLEEIFEWLKANRASCEIVVNDWGVLEMLRRDNGFFKIALGRLLTRQQRDPSIKKLLKKQLPTAVKTKDDKIIIYVHRVPAKSYQTGIKKSYLNSKSAQDFLSRLGVERVELNNIIQGLNVEGLYLRKSLYTPYINISTTRFCPMETKYQKIYRINVCKKECQARYDELRNKGISKVIYKIGNTTFYRNPVKISGAINFGVDRIVYQLLNC